MSFQNMGGPRSQIARRKDEPMKYSQAKLGRVFVARLFQDDRLPDCIEQLAQKEGINAATVMLVGGIEQGTIVVGPKEGTSPPEPTTAEINGPHEILAVGMIFPTAGKPVLHMHAAFGRAQNTLVGCTRTGISTYTVIEAVITELLDCCAQRQLDPRTGWHLLEP